MSATTKVPFTKGSRLNRYSLLVVTEATSSRLSISRRSVKMIAMIDIELLRKNPEAIRKSVKDRRMKIDVDEIVRLDDELRRLRVEVEEKRALKNRAGEKIAAAKGDEKKRLISEMRESGGELNQQEKKLSELDEKFRLLFEQVPNIALPDVPVGKDETENVVRREVGKKRKFDFPVKDYLTIAEALDVIDVKTASKVAGTRFGYLKGGAAMMEFALIQYTLATLTNEKALAAIAKKAKLKVSSKPFVPVVPPVMIRPDVFAKMARLEPRDDRFHIQSDDLYLAGSAEHTIGPLHMDHTFDEMELPVRYIGFSTCFRREAGSYGKDTKGILRVHQFDKLEMESFCLPETSKDEQNFHVAVAAHLMDGLEIPYRIVDICTGDMGAPDARQIDIEAWMPGQNEYRETHTADLMTDYQSRRLGTKFRREGKSEFVHMADATAFAMPRTLIAIIENYQNADGSVTVPKILRPYVGMEKISLHLPDHGKK